MIISIIIPVYNEKNYIKGTLDRLASVNFENAEKEIIIVDDGSIDGSGEILKTFEKDYKIIYHQTNQGKGAALKTGLAAASGEIIIIQDADWEYDPADMPKLIKPIVTGQTEVVYGSRMLGKNPVGHWRYYLGNEFISLLTSILYHTRLTDVETGYKVFKKNIIQKFQFVSNDFGIEAELTAKFLKNKIKILELPISYAPRKFDEGKKINWRDGVKAIYILIKCRF